MLCVTTVENMTFTPNVDMADYGPKNVARMNAVMMKTKGSGEENALEDVDPLFVTISCIDSGNAPEQFTEEIR